jgi:hypothetical protein
LKAKVTKFKAKQPRILAFLFLNRPPQSEGPGWIPNGSSICVAFDPVEKRSCQITSLYGGSLWIMSIDRKSL